ncbi:MAG: hypothetical protein ACW992_11670, partial [Candidatus Thorarchaeota archaeon]
IVGVGKPLQFAQHSFFWVAIPSKEMTKLQPLYEIIDNSGQWIGSISFNEDLSPKFLPIGSMTAGTPRGAEEPWTLDLPAGLKAGADAFLKEAKEQIEVILALR